MRVQSLDNLLQMEHPILLAPPARISGGLAVPVSRAGGARPNFAVGFISLGA
jgi:hypothetical protein